MSMSNMNGTAAALHTISIDNKISQRLSSVIKQKPESKSIFKKAMPFSSYLTINNMAEYNQDT